MSGQPAAGSPAAAGSSAEPPSADREPTAFEALVTDYRELERLTEEPIFFVDYGLCRLPIRGLDTPVHRPSGEIHVYGNELTVEPMAESGARVFPPGSVIVKEKLAADQPAGMLIAGLGMMMKDEGGAWSYAYYEDGRMFEGIEELELCRQCHATGQVPEGLEDILGLDPWGGTIELPVPRDSVFLTLPPPAMTAR
jgi:hypothetical protein